MVQCSDQTNGTEDLLWWWKLSYSRCTWTLLLICLCERCFHGSFCELDSGMILHKIDTCSFLLIESTRSAACYSVHASGKRASGTARIDRFLLRSTGKWSVRSEIGDVPADSPFDCKLDHKHCKWTFCVSYRNDVANILSLSLAVHRNHRWSSRLILNLLLLLWVLEMN